MRSTRAKQNPYEIHQSSHTQEANLVWTCFAHGHMFLPIVLLQDDINQKVTIDFLHQTKVDPMQSFASSNRVESL